MSKLFFAYPNNPKEIGSVIENGIESAKKKGVDVKSWTAQDIIGAFIPKTILNNISERTLIADITVLNPNVVYEIGYAIGIKKHILITKNESITEQNPTIQEVGIFDTLGYASYQNSEELASIIIEDNSNQPYKGFEKANLHAPIFILDTQFKTDYSSRIISRINISNLYYRSFDPSESPRLSGLYAIKEVSESYGVIIQLLGKEVKNQGVHNIRAAFIAGLAAGMNVPCRILQYGYSVIPVDYRDEVNIFKKHSDIDDIIAGFVIDVVKEMQEIEPYSLKQRHNSLEKLDFGASAAENEMRKLQRYYLPTDTFTKTLRGEIQVVLGRKGSGKTAIFYQISSKEKSSSKNVLLDLQPEGYKLIKFKEQVLDFLEEGSFQHTIMAFWKYLLLLEVAHKILEIDEKRHYSIEKLYEPYKALEKAYHSNEHLTQGDFSERMSFLMDRLQKRFNEKYNGQSSIRLSNPEVTGLVHSTNIRDLEDALIEYLKNKERVWILFDNIDKGWPANGLTKSDLVMIRSLIDAAKILQRVFERAKVNFYPVIFLRSDVYYQLVLETSDRQKESKASLDWTEPDLLKRLVELRLIATDENDATNIDFLTRWRKFAVSHYKGEDSFQFIIDRSLMRPRFLINFLNHCKSFAVNLNHEKIEEDDIQKGFRAYSSDVLEDMELEIKDVFPNSNNILSAFYHSPVQLNEGLLDEKLSVVIDKNEEAETIKTILLFYGFLGVIDDENCPKYIYEVNYNMQLLSSIRKRVNGTTIYRINPAFWHALQVKE